MTRLGQKRAPKVNPEAETALADYHPRPLSVKEEKFCVQFVMTDDRHLSYERAGYLAKNPNVQSAAITRLLKQPKIKARIEELTTEMLLAQGVTKERVTANLAEIGFNKANTKADRNTALRTLAQTLGMLSDTVNINDTVGMRELDAREAEECRQIALIRLKMQISGQSIESTGRPLLEANSDVQGQEQAEGSCKGSEGPVEGKPGYSGYSGYSKPGYSSNGYSNAVGQTVADTEASVIQSDDGRICTAIEVACKEEGNKGQAGRQQADGGQLTASLQPLSEALDGQKKRPEGQEQTPLCPPEAGGLQTMVSTSTCN